MSEPGDSPLTPPYDWPLSEPEIGWEQFARNWLETALQFAQNADYWCGEAQRLMSAPGVVDLSPESTAEILTWALRIARRVLKAGYAVTEHDVAWDCPPHVREALRKVTT